MLNDLNLLKLNDLCTQNEHTLKSATQASIESTENLDELESLRLYYLGKQGVVSQALKSLGALSPDERRESGPKFNQLRDFITQSIKNHRAHLENAALDKTLAAEKLDVSLPVYPSDIGSHHLITSTLNEIQNYFQTQGFHVKGGPDIESEYYNFDALNIPKHHPARQSHDTFYIDHHDNDLSLLLRTHTSTIQIRTLEHEKPPLRVLAPGRVYRADFDATHLPMFHQIEGFVIEDHIHIGHLKGTLTEFCRHFFEQNDLNIRFRPSFFPFTEPSFEVDMWWHDRWLEILGCGMIHPHVLKNMGLDPNQHQGFAFGLGVDRFAMLKYNVKDIRHFTANDMRWSKQANLKTLP